MAVVNKPRPVAAPGSVDVHHHIRVPGTPAAALRPWSATEALYEMDAQGVGLAITYAGGVPAPRDSAGTAAALARTMNEYSAALVSSHPTRFGMFAALPMLDVDATLQEIDYCIEALDCDGFALNTSYAGRWLGDPVFAPIMDLLNDRGAVVFVHPNDYNTADLTYGGGAVTGPWLEWPTNTARTILDLMTSGTIARTPKLRYIFCHGGGVAPLLISRIAGLADWRAMEPESYQQLFPRPVEEQFASLYFELAQSYAEENYAALSALVPPSHILFGSDWDNFHLDHASTAFRQMRIDPKGREEIGRANALTLLGRASAS